MWAEQNTAIDTLLEVFYDSRFHFFKEISTY